MKDKKKKGKPGRKKIIIDWNKVDRSLIAGANGVQVASMLGISFDTLSRRCNEEKNADFAEYLRQKRQEGNEKLLSAQYNLAMKGDRGMLIWLGKNRLDQSDKKDITQKNIGSLINVSLSTSDEKPIQSESDQKDE